MQQVQATSPYPYYYYMPVQMEGDQQQGVPMAAFAVETPQPEIVQPKEETKKEVKECDAEDQKKKRKPKFKKLSGCQKFFVVIGVLAFIGFFVKLLGVGIGLTVISHMYQSCENPPHHLERQWATDPSIASNIRLDITSAMIHVRTCPHAKSITIHTSSRSKNPEDLNRMIPTYKVMDGSIILTAKFPAFDFDSCASVKVDVVVPESLANPANLFVTTETGVVYVLPNKHHKEHHEDHHHGFKNTTSRPEIFNNIDISTKAGHVEVAHVHTRGTISVFSKVGGVTLKDVTATFLTGSTITGFVNVEHVRVGQLTAIADSGSVTVKGVIFEEKINLDTYFLQASIDIGNLEVKRIWNKLNAEHTAVVSVNSGSGRSEVKLSKKANLKFAVSTVSGDIELHGKDLPKLIEDTEISKTGRIEGHGALTDVTIATSSGRAHVGFRECKRHHDKKHDNKDDEKPKEETHDADPSETTTEHDKPKIHPHHTKPHKTNQPVTGGKHQERPHRTHA